MVVVLEQELNWHNDICLHDLEDDQLLEATCLRCGHVWNTYVDEVRPLMEHPDVYLDEVARALVCKRPGCGHQGVKLSLLRRGETSAFIAGMP